MRERRVNSRYDVSTTTLLKGRTSKSPKGERLLTFSTAGCGFCSLLDEFKLKVGDVLRCEFELDGMDPVKVSGAILFCNPYPIVGQIGRFYGIRFLGNSERLIKPIMDELEALNDRGQICLAQ